MVTYLKLYVGDLVPREIKFVYGNARLLEISEKTELLGSQNEKSVAAAAFAASRSTDSVNIFLWIVGRIELDYPIDVRNIETSGRHIGTQ